MRSLPVALAAALLLLFSLPATGWAAATSSPPVPSCAAGPERSGDEIVGTPCADRIVVPASVEFVDAGAGDDTIVGANSGPVAASTGTPETGLHLEVGSQTFEGGPGNDVVYGDRGNDTLRGNAGNDRLYGGIGDDVLEGGEGDDILSGGFGADKIDGQAGNDYVRGDATIDHIFDTGGGFDTLSFATGATPGFTAESNPTGAANFPGPTGERGVWLKLNEGGNNALDGEPSLGGGNDEVQPGVFERIIGTPFSDYIVGSSAGEEIWGGGGADVIKGGGGADQLRGGAEGDFIEAASSEASIDGEGGADNCVGTVNPASCAGTAQAVNTRNTGLVSVGETTAISGLTQVYLVGSSGNDNVNVSYTGSGNVEFTLSGASFDTSVAEPGRCTISAGSASCPVSGLLDAIVLAGMGGSDSISASVPDGVGVIELGGAGGDTLNGTVSEDVLVDGVGASADALSAGAGDDALTHNGGPDFLDGGVGSDLFLSVSICDGETISGGAIGANDRDNASWARLAGTVDARIDQSRVGEVGAADQPVCASGRSFDALTGIEDLEGSNGSDVLYGDEGSNQLLGHKGEDTYFALGGNDSILANSGTRDRIINCGPGLDQATIDFASIGDPTPIECEQVREGAAEEFKELPLLTEPPPPSPPPPLTDHKPPRTELRRHPAKLLRVAPGRRKLVAFRFSANEVSTFECKLDRKPYRPCRSPRSFRVGLGRHSFKLFAIDAAGNRDRTPAVFSFRVVRAKSAHARR
jgi:Ca2+-binding RTX toxin-like protein